MGYIVLICCWIQFANILFRDLACLHGEMFYNFPFFCCQVLVLRLCWSHKMCWEMLPVFVFSGIISVSFSVASFLNVWKK